MEFKDYLIETVGKKHANRLLRMTKKEKERIPIIVTGDRSGTGKSTLIRVLNANGYHAIESYECEIIELNNVINDMIPGFSETVKHIH